jgi:ppGpp synthetase/RelA/SpoT-type nucleotidyltranferase
MTALEDFRLHLTERRPELQAWGRFVLERIRQAIDPEQVSLQIAASRAKEIESAIGKIARKNYKEPLTQMTDLVGVRLVVLISPQIDPIASIIESCDEWTATLDRDSEQEILAAPESFSYQSKHYVVRCKADLEFEGQAIKAGLPCEIQIRTILQHAYAEITHDSIYKPSAGKIPHKARRFVASSMALIETADHLFCETMRLLDEENRPRNQFWKGLVDLYDSSLGDVGMGYDEKLNLAVLDQLEGYRTDTAMEEIKYLFQNRGVLLTKIKGRISSDSFWSQPTALFAYWLVGKDSMHAFNAWPFASAHDALAMIYSDLGQSPPQH